MSELIEVPKWFDAIHREVIKVIENEFSYIHKPEDKANELLIKSISNHGFGYLWTDDLLGEIMYPSMVLINMIQHKEDEKIEYVSHNRIDLIRAIVNGYKVKEDSYLVVSISDYESTRWSVEETALIYSSNISKVRHLYYEDDNQLESYKELDSEIYISGFDFELGKKWEAKQDFIKILNELEPKLIITKEKAEGLINSYRMMIPIN